MNQSALSVLCSSILKGYIKHVENKELVASVIRQHYQFIPVNSRYKVRRSVIFNHIAERLRLPLNPTVYALIADVLLSLGVRPIEAQGYKYFKGIISKEIELTEAHTRVIHSCGTHETYRLKKKAVSG